jgi:ribose transport system substrate-binding protein
MTSIGKLTTLAFAVVFAVSCGGSTRSDSRTSPTLRFAVIPKSLDLPVFNYARIGAERAARELGDVEILWNGPIAADQLKQKEILESFITQRVDGIAISTLAGDFLSETINRAIDAGIPVVTWDSDAPASRRHAFYGVDDIASGRILGEEAARLLDGTGKVAVITSIGATNLARRLQGVQEALAKHPGMEIIETYDIKEDPVRCAEIIATGSARYPDLGAWIAVGGWPVFTRNALDGLPAHVKFVSFDTIPPAPDLLKAGKVQVLLGQKYFGWGSESVRLLHDIRNGRMPAEPVIDSGVDVVTAENVDEYLEEWKRMEAGL